MNHIIVHNLDYTIYNFSFTLNCQKITWKYSFTFTCISLKNGPSYFENVDKNHEKLIQNLLKILRNLEKWSIFDDIIFGKTASPLVINSHHLETPSPLGDDIICESECLRIIAV